MIIKAGVKARIVRISMDVTEPSRSYWEKFIGKIGTIDQDFDPEKILGYIEIAFDDGLWYPATLDEIEIVPS
jgi:hypothetical protein